MANPREYLDHSSRSAEKAEIPVLPIAVLLAFASVAITTLFVNPPQSMLNVLEGYSVEIDRQIFHVGRITH